MRSIGLTFFAFQSWEAIPPDTANFTPDITPLVLAAHRDNYEIIKILLDRGAILPVPHDVRYAAIITTTTTIKVA